MKKKPDERAIERDYCAGQLSLRAIADKYGIKESTLRYWAKQNGWIRQKGDSKQAAQSTAQTAQESAQSAAQEKTKKSPLEPVIKKTKNEYFNSDFEYEESELDRHEFGINERQAIFAVLVGRGYTRADAYRAAGYICEGEILHIAASQLYRNIKVRAAIDHVMSKRLKKLNFTADDVLQHAIEIVNANPNSVIQYQRVNCRHCWGKNHAYQWIDEEEFFEAEQEAEAKREAGRKGVRMPSARGGYGFLKNGDPNLDCPKCSGEGEGRTFVPDSRDVPLRDRRLLAGVKEGKNGIEVLTRNQDMWLKFLADRLLPPIVGAGQGERPAAGSYGPDDYKKAAKWLDDEFNDLD